MSCSGTISEYGGPGTRISRQPVSSEYRGDRVRRAAWVHEPEAAGSGDGTTWRRPPPSRERMPTSAMASASVFPVRRRLQQPNHHAPLPRRHPRSAQYNHVFFFVSVIPKRSTNRSI